MSTEFWTTLTAFVTAVGVLGGALVVAWGIISAALKDLKHRTDALHERTMATDKALIKETGRNDLIISTATAADRTARDAAIVTKQLAEQIVGTRIDIELIKELVKAQLQERIEDKTNLAERDKIITDLRQELKFEKERRMSE